MREVFIDIYEGVFHPCDIVDFRKNIITGNMLIFFYDRAEGEYYYAHLYKKGEKYYVDDIKFYFEMNLPKLLASKSLVKAKVSNLPLYIKNIHHKIIKNDDVLVEVKKGIHSPRLIKRLEFLELKSYADAINGPIYYYFIIKKAILNENGYIYTLKYTCQSDKPLRKNIIAKHETMNSLDDLLFENGLFTYIYDQHDEIIEDQTDEKKIALKIIEMSKPKRPNMDTILVSKIARMMLSESDRLKAARQYELYLIKYYDNWIKEKEEKQKKYSL